MDKLLRTTLQGRDFFPALSLTCLCLVGILTQFAIIPVAHAASTTSNPLVIVATDTTPSICTITHTVKKLSASSVTHMHCPAGTAISLSKIPLSQAKIHRENYVTYPAL